MRIMQVHWAMPPTVGGVESHLASLAHRLVASGHDVAVLSGETKPEPIGKVDHILDPALREPHRLTAKEFRELAGAIADWEPDVVHAHNLIPLSPSVEGAVIFGARAAGARVFHTWHAEWSDYHWPPMNTGWDGLLVASSYLKQSLSRKGIAASALPLPVDSRQFCAPPLSEFDGTLRILYPSRLVAEKGALIALEAFARVLDAGVDAKITLADTPKMFDRRSESHEFPKYLKRLSASAFEGGRVRFMRSSFADMPSVYGDAQVVICPSVIPEPHGLAVLESMSCRRVVIAADLGGVRETIVSGQSGILVEPADPVAVTTAVLDVIGNWSAARAMAEQARERVVRVYGFDPFVKNLLDTYTGSDVAVPA